MDNIYGVELILDLHNCDTKTFNRPALREYFNSLCKLIDMKPEALYFWDDMGIPKYQRQTNPKTRGTSAVQFILTSNITVHTLDLLEAAYINIFSCKEFSTEGVEKYTVDFFRPKSYTVKVVERT